MNQNFEPSNMPPPCIITGAARSGTSLVAGSVARCGAFGGICSGPNLHNKKGMHENARIRNTITKPYLRDIGMDPLGQYPLPDTSNLPIPTNWRSRVEQVMIDEGYQKGPWFYKGAKVVLTWPVWAYAFPSAKFIIVRRRSGDIASSCTKTGFMKAFSRSEVQRAVGVNNERDGWLFWIREHEKRFIEMISSGLNIKFVWPEKMVSGDYSEIYEAIEWLGLKWNPEVLSWVDPLLWKARRK